MEDATTECSNFEKLVVVEKEPDTLRVPTFSEWFSTRPVYKTYARSKQRNISVKNLQEHETICVIENLEEVKETTTESVDFLTSQDPLMCMKEEVVDEHDDEDKEAYDILYENCFPKVTNKEAREEKLNDKENVDQVEEGHEILNESDSDFFDEDSNFFDHSYTHESSNIHLNLQEVCSLTNKDHDQGSRDTDKNEPLPYEQEKVVNEYDDKITIEEHSLNMHALQIFEDNTEVAEPKEAIIESSNEKQQVPDKSKPEVCLKKKSYKCTVCQKILDLKQCLKIQIVVQKEKKYIYCEDCFKHFARTRSSITQTVVQKKHILREAFGMDANVSGVHQTEKGWL